MVKKLLVKNNKGEPSSTLTVFLSGSFVALLKLLFSGMTFGEFTVPVFTGSEFGMVMAALGAVYVLRKNVDKKEDK
jgi:hypothetical protein